MVVWLMKVRLFLSLHGLKPIEVAVLGGNCRCVEILFPVTSPIPSYADGSVNGTMKHANPKKFEKEVTMIYLFLSLFEILDSVSSFNILGPN
ncbi:hypothetical protein C5167_046540 [Papaver somniferum]|uniref:Uncharacterized protein n=1 Tax=Papaver somniferum TaxID=3469 RepID=A0A4Y7LEU4_PAPSO|nr:hypothetical protein C5167_046540 [Papaver somniferum]